MVVETLSQAEWDDICATIGFYNVFRQQSFVSTYSNCYKLGVEYYIVRDKTKNYTLLGCFTKENTIVIPNYFMFNPFWVNRNLGNVSVNNSLKLLLEYLKKSFINITLRLPVDFDDIRPFLWQGFQSTLKYTYVKKVTRLDYHKNIRRILKKDSKAYTFSIIEWNSEIEERLVPELLHIKFRKSSVPEVISSFRHLCQSGEMLIFAGFLDGVMVAFDLVLEDSYESKAYMFFISKSYNHYQSGFPAFLYDYVFKKMKERGIEKVDLYGANIPEIAMFKSKFNPELENFYEVNYSRNRTLFQTIWIKLRRLVNFTLAFANGF
ncbi:hypothetical protein [Desertivirga arenae]|uniref:hypothetical protein n=1 Tax=Desertivirga arenae TaxID=2810309 RepID=UPI001A978B6C|nr:hypothetical protein [Pedobacter sp. SYSU D00823]